MLTVVIPPSVDREVPRVRGGGEERRQGVPAGGVMETPHQ